VLRAGLDWVNITVLRAYAKFLRQAGITYSQSYMMNVLAGNPEIVRRIIDLFHVRFDPASDQDRLERAAIVVEGIWPLLDAVTSLDEDRILRRFVNLVLN